MCVCVCFYEIKPSIRTNDIEKLKRENSKDGKYLQKQTTKSVALQQNSHSSLLSGRWIGCGARRARWRSDEMKRKRVEEVDAKEEGRQESPGDEGETI